MFDIDELIDELFPTEGHQLKSATDKQGMSKELPASMADWDLSDEDGEGNKNNKNADGDGKEGCSTKAKEVEQINGTVADRAGYGAKNGSSKSYFDDSDEGECTEGGVTTSSLTVPFPSFPENIGGVCRGKCFVTNVGAKGLRHPGVSRLLVVSEGRYDTRATKKQLFEYKGAFHVVDPRVGNGASDKFAEESTSGGCLFMLCRKCNYVVVRLQDAAWQDDGGAINLYLTVRNYYPDWSQLANSYPVGHKGSDGQLKVLMAKTGCAAYCCQCSWLTVESAQETIETGLTDHTKFLTQEETNCFASQLPLPKGERRRPPLWVCQGHMPQF